MKETTVTAAGVIDTFLLLLIGIGPKLALVPLIKVSGPLDPEVRAAVRRRMLMTAGTTALVLILLGELLRALLHFTVGSLSVAGGVILLVLAVRMSTVPESSRTYRTDCLFAQGPISDTGHPTASTLDSVSAMSGDADHRHGQVFIAPHPHPDRAGSFTAYWDNEEPDKDEPPRILEQGPAFAEVEEAVGWGRARARRVLVRLGNDQATMYSAGSERLPWLFGSPDDLLPEWPLHR